MPTSMFPVKWVFVPQKLIELATSNSSVLVNLRPEQRPRPTTEEEARRERIRAALDDAYAVHDPVLTFLKNLPKKTRISLHFQGYGIEVGTAVVVVDSIYWALGYPRLDFKHPKAMTRIYGCPNFWGAFILAIAEVTPEAELFCKRDKNALRFTKIVNTYGIVRPLLE